MKFKSLFFISLFVLSSVLCFSSEEVLTKETTGLEWLQMSIGDRMECVMVSMYVLKQHGVALDRSPNDYYNAVEERLKANTDLYAVSVTNVLASIIYEKDPKSREVLDRNRGKPEIKKIEMH